jgi:RND family efflux transporter MFP subunit
MNRTLILTSLAALLAGLACGTRETAQAPALPTAKVHLAQEGSAAGEGWVATTLTATRRATLSTRLAASVRRVLVNEGQSVQAGALLVSLSDEDLQGGLRAAEAAVSAAGAQHRRIEALLKQGAAIPAEMDQATTQLAEAQAALAQVKANIAYTQIRAPFAGVVQGRLVNEGAFVGPGTPLVELEGQGDLELDGAVSDQEAKGLKIGMKLPFQAEARTGIAQITALATGGDPVSHRGTLRARIVKGAEGLRTGAFARIQLPGAPAQAPGLQVPRSALVPRGELTGVFVARDGKAELHWLSLGEPQGDLVPVRAGIKAGDAVIDRPEGLVDGQPIEVVK